MKLFSAVTEIARNVGLLAPKRFGAFSDGQIVYAEGSWDWGDGAATMYSDPVKVLNYDGRTRKYKVEALDNCHYLGPRDIIEPGQVFWIRETYLHGERTPIIW